MEHEVKEHLTVDSVMTADGEVVPLGPVDKEGRKVSLSTATLFADSGMECTVKRYEYLLGAGVWRPDERYRSCYELPCQRRTDARLQRCLWDMRCLR